MKEALLILLIILVLTGLTAFRYRKQLVTMLNVWRMLKSIRQQVGGQKENQVEAGNRLAGPLVNCAKCGAWMPEGRAIKLGRTSYYCSADCMQTSAKVAGNT